jgi:hypothetical protein
LEEAGRCDRFDYLHDATKEKFGTLGVAGVEDLLAHVAQGKMTLQSMVFEPSNRVIYLAVGSAAHTKGYHRLELSKYFK